MKKLSLVVLFYNEEENVKKVISNLKEELEKRKANFELIAVSNGSTDKTPELLKEINSIKIVTIKKNIGYGYGVLKGLEACKGELVGYCWGDDQVSAEDVFKIYHKIAKDPSISLCKGKRKIREGLLRTIISKIYNCLFRILFSVKLNDINACPKIMRREYYKKIKLVQKDWFVDAEIVLKIVAKGGKIVEVPINYKKRERGSSNVKGSTVFEFLLNMIKYRINKKKLF